MIRKLFNFCTFLSLALCCGTIWWWSSRSPASIDQLSFRQSSKQSTDVWASNGKLMFTSTVHSVADPSDTRQLTWGSSPLGHGPAAPAGGTSWLAFSYSSEPIATKSGGGAQTTVIIPAWLIVSTFAMLPLVWVTGKMKRSKKPKGEKK